MPNKKKSAHKRYITPASIRSMSSRSRMLAILGFMVVFAGVGMAFVANSHAANTYILCDTGDASLPQQCLNAKAGGTAAGTLVIAWQRDYDPNERFTFQFLSGMCNAGRVSSTCPFDVGSGLNNRYLNDAIVQIRDQNTGNECVGNGSNGGAYAALQTCGNTSGSGGGYGTIFVYNSGGLGTAGFVESRYWSDFEFEHGHYNTPAWMCDVLGHGGQIEVEGITLSSNGPDGTCQWNTFSN
jgi:hypothetical protein